MQEMWKGKAIVLVEDALKWVYTEIANAELNKRRASERKDIIAVANLERKLYILNYIKNLINEDGIKKGRENND